MEMGKSRYSILLLVSWLSACAASLPSRPPVVDRQTRFSCEQQAAIARAGYMARVKTPMYTSSISRTWAGGARSDTGQWVFDNTLQTCMLQAQHALQP